MIQGSASATGGSGWCPSQHASPSAGLLHAAAQPPPESGYISCHCQNPFTSYFSYHLFPKASPTEGQFPLLPRASVRTPRRRPAATYRCACGTVCSATCMSVQICCASWRELLLLLLLNTVQCVCDSTFVGSPCQLQPLSWLVLTINWRSHPRWNLSYCFRP